eukprot:scaffold9928_cov67-Skeletonema_marinoi.AAC.1
MSFHFHRKLCSTVEVMALVVQIAREKCRAFSYSWHLQMQSTVARTEFSSKKSSLSRPRWRDSSP